jgi:hypothetical protein
VSDRLQKQVSVELEQLHRLLRIHQPLLDKCGNTSPNQIELSALAAMLHSFYTGIENIFKRVAVEMDGGPPTGEIWHRRLLDSMTRPGTDRPAVIHSAFRDVLRGYLDFRHVFRHAYTHELQWRKMSALVLGCQETFRQLEVEFEAFFRALESSKDC